MSIIFWLIMFIKKGRKENKERKNKKKKKERKKKNNQSKIEKSKRHWSLEILKIEDIEVLKTYTKIRTRLVKKQTPKQIRSNTHFLFKKIMRQMWNESIQIEFLITNNEIKTFAFCFLRSIRRYTRSNRIEENRTRCIKLHTCKCFILIPNHRYVINWFCKSFPIKSRIICIIIMDQ